jgi:uncharacterized protein DUF4287
MPKQKDLKRLVRERMRKTGEAYTAARARVLEKKPEARKPPASPPGPDLAALGGMSDDSVAKKTGRTWKEWVAVLDRAGAAAKPHPDIVALLHSGHGLPGWWAQMVTVGYERIKGLRERGQRRDGTFDVAKSKVYPVPLAELWTAFVRCDRWLGEAKLRMSKATKHKSMRMRWMDGSPVEANFYSKSPTKSQVQLQHGKIATRAEAVRLRVFWGERLAELGKVIAES